MMNIFLNCENIINKKKLFLNGIMYSLSNNIKKFWFFVFDLIFNNNKIKNDIIVYSLYLCWLYFVCREIIFVLLIINDM